MKMRVLVACEFSGIVREAFRARGHDAWSCDLEPSEIEGKHIQADIMSLLTGRWDMMIAHPPCTYLCNSGVCFIAGNPERQASMRKAADFFNALRNAPIYRIAVENPIPHRYAKEIIGRYHQRIEPWEFGEPENKPTCLWLKNLPPLFATIIETRRVPRLWALPPSAYPAGYLSRERSRTYKGIADAMAAQWG